LRDVTVFVTKPFRAEKERYKRAEEQLRLLKHVTMEDLNELLMRMPNAPFDVALDEFNKEIAMEKARLRGCLVVEG